MKKRWFVVVLTIGLLLSVLPLSALALSPDPYTDFDTITDADDNLLDWYDLSTDPYSPDDSDVESDTNATSDQTDPVKNPADEDRDEAADGPSAANSTPQRHDEELEDEELEDEELEDKELEDHDLADEGRDEAAAYGLSDDTPADDTDITPEAAVCKIGDTHYYSTLDAAIRDATEGDQIDLLTNIEWNEGLTFEGKTLTISGGGHKLTLEKNGMYALDSVITFEDLTLNIHAHTHTNEGAGNTANLIVGSTLHLSHVTLNLSPDGPCGSGIYLHKNSDLYLENDTRAFIHDFHDLNDDEAIGTSGIYADEYSEDDHGIWVTSSYLEVTDCDWNGMTIDPINLTLDNAGVYFTRNGTSGYGGLGCYGVGSHGGTLTMKSSTLTSTGNYGGQEGFGIYVGVLDMDAASTLYATDNQGSGVGIGNSRGGESHIRGQIYCSGNGTTGWPGSGGFNVYAEHDKKRGTTYEGNVTIEPGAYIYACNNKGLAGVLNSWILNIENGATVIADNNEQNGFANSLDARATIKSGANVSANYNGGNGILNYAGAGDMSKDNESKGKGSFLIEGGAQVTATGNAEVGICNTVYNRSYGSFDDDGNPTYNPENDCFTIRGGADVSADGNGLYGIYNEGGIFTIENGANISTCNNVYGILNNIHGTFTIDDANISTCNNYHGIFNYTNGTFTIENGANISTCNNSHDGIYNTNSGTFTMETGANVSVCNNSRYGIFNNTGTFTVENGVDLQVEYNKESGVVNVENSKLTLLSGCVRYNTTNNLYGYGGGLRNYGEATLSNDVQLYNNHAAIGGDDIENGEYATITFGPTGKGWELDGAPDCYDFIDGWYDDYKTTRWNAHEENGAKLHMVLVAPVTSHFGPLSLKAAHGSLSTGSLTVRKETAGELLPSDYDTAFTFELTLDDDTITTIDDQWCGIPFKNGKASFTLKSGESITLSNLPAGIGYTITEAAQDNWTLMNINDAETGVVPQNDTAEVVFTNLKKSLDLPDVPILPILPIEPEEPEEPEIPEIPNEPEKPQTPEMPEKPEGPETPKESEEPEIPEEPEKPQTPEVPEEPEGPETPKETEETKAPAQNTTAETLIQTGTTDWLAAVLLISGFGLLVCGWFFNRKQRAAKH